MDKITPTEKDRPVSTLWGCELTESNKEETFKTDDAKQQQLALRTMCLGMGAKEELNVVELITGDLEKGKAVPVATLHVNGMPMVNLSGIDLYPPIKFILKSGSGPLFVCGEHMALDEDISDSEDDEEMADELVEEEEEEEEDIEESPVKPVKKQTAKKNGTAAGKRKKPEEEPEDDGPPSEEENNPPKKGRGGRGRGKKT